MATDLNTQSTFTSLKMLDGSSRLGTFVLVRLWDAVFYYSEAAGTVIPETSVRNADVS